MIEVIFSGGQTGVDRAALDAALRYGVKHGGWCPKGRRAEDGVIHDKYLLQETETDDYSERTKKNIQDSDATLIFVPKLPLEVKDGTVLTIQEIESKRRKHLIVDLSSIQDIGEAIVKWIRDNDIKILNIAGPRESQAKGIYQTVFDLLSTIMPTLIYKCSYSQK
jgi:hypothetical protein